MNEQLLHIYPPLPDGGGISNAELVVEFTDWSPENTVVDYDPLTRTLLFTNNLTGETVYETC